MFIFLNKNKTKKFLILDIPLYLENKLNKKNDIIVFIESKNKDIKSRLLKRKNYNSKLLKLLKKIQLPLVVKKRKSNFIIKNNFSIKKAKKSIKHILTNLRHERNNFDTETTGLKVRDGHRIVEIGCIELENLIPTKKTFHCYLNPERKVSEKAFEVHGYSDEFLSKQKKFSDIADEFSRIYRKQKN